MLNFWNILIKDLSERTEHLYAEGDVNNARALEDVCRRAEWVAMDIADYPPGHEMRKSARRVYASWKQVYTDGIAREHLDEAEANARAIRPLH